MAKFDYSINRYLLSKAENNLDIEKNYIYNHFVNS